MITYNHEKYIAQAIESVMMQETNFDYELIIGEDCSTDSTRSICLAYQKKYPDKIKLRLPEKNIGMMPNFIENLKACTGKYVALLEGDDYWIHTHKLQKQVDFLDANPEFAICFHNAIIHSEDNSAAILLSSSSQQAVSTIFELARNNFVTTLTCVFRNKLFENFPKESNKLPIGDWPLHLLNAQFGKVYYLKEAMAVYRKHAGGIWSTETEINMLLKLNFVAQVMNKHLKYKYKTEFMKGMFERSFRIAQLIHSNKYTGFVNAYIGLFKYYRCLLYSNYYQIIKLGLKHYLPGLYSIFYNLKK
jgi:glycosyltransferase involved in cell wall biosynthesis